MFAAIVGCGFSSETIIEVQQALEENGQPKIIEMIQQHKPIP